MRHDKGGGEGQGYPDGLAAEHIPLEGRLLALADTYDAMPTDRPSRPALPVARALEEIRARSGTQFDPDLAKVFVDLPLAPPAGG